MKAKGDTTEMYSKRILPFIAATWPAWAILIGGCDQGQTSMVRTEQSAAPAAPPEPRYLDQAHAPTGSGWVDLISADLSGWRPRNADRPLSWKVVDGVMINTFPEGQHGVDIITDRKFDDFEIYYEYRIPRGSNSGVYLQGRYEIQVVDDHGRPPSKGGNGALYSTAAPSKNVSKPAGEWQSVYARIADNKITIVLNGEKVIDSFEVTRPTGGELDNKVGEPGPVMIQGDHGPIEVRVMQVRPLN